MVIGLAEKNFKLQFFFQLYISNYPYPNLGFSIESLENLDFNFVLIQNNKI